MKKEIFKTILFFIILFTLVYPIYATCTHEVGPSCSKENCGETWEHTSSQITREIPYHPFYETVTVCEESISIIGTECKVFESCQEGCTLCYFEPESLATMEWADSVNVYLLYNTYRDEFMNNLHKLTNLAVLKSYPAMLKDLMDTKYSIDFYIGDAEDLSITSDGHLHTLLTPYLKIAKNKDFEKFHEQLNKKLEKAPIQIFYHEHSTKNYICEVSACSIKGNSKNTQLFIKGTHKSLSQEETEEIKKKIASNLEKLLS